MSNTLGSRIRQTRKKRKLTQLQLAMQTYISESYLALIEQDKRNPSMDVVIEIAKVLKVSADYLLFGDAEQTDTALFNEWKKLTNGRTPQEIESANNLIKCYFENIDSLKNQR